MFAETCPDCGAGRPSWMGGSHWRRQWPDKTRDRRVCMASRKDDTALPEPEFWELIFGAPRPWLVS